MIGRGRIRTAWTCLAIGLLLTCFGVGDLLATGWNQRSWLSVPPAIMLFAISCFMISGWRVRAGDQDPHDDDDGWADDDGALADEDEINQRF